MEQYPLKGYRVLDFGWVAAGPFLTNILADYGAEVIKIESRERLDSMRFSPDNTSLDPEKDLWFHSLNRNKLGVTINLKFAEGIELVKQLVKISDVVVENFAPHVMSQHGLTYDELKKIRSEIIYISLPALGRTGSWKDLITYGQTLQAICGIESLVGYPGERVLGLQQAFADFNAGIHGCLAVLAALYYRQRTSKGQDIEISQAEAAISTIGEVIMEYTMNRRVLSTLGNTSPIMAPHNNYPCRGEDKWVSIAIKSEDEWNSFCKAIGEPPWTKESRFADRYTRLKNCEELDRLIAAWTINHTDYEIMEILQKVGVAAVPCLDMEGRFLDPHFNDRQTYAVLEHPATGADWVPNTPWKLSDTPGGLIRPAPFIGEHNRYVFGELLGLSEAEIRDLIEKKVIY